MGILIFFEAPKCILIYYASAEKNIGEGVKRPTPHPPSLFRLNHR